MEGGGVISTDVLSEIDEMSKLSIKRRVAFNGSLSLTNQMEAG